MMSSLVRETSVIWTQQFRADGEIVLGIPTKQQQQAIIELRTQRKTVFRWHVLETRLTGLVYC